MLGSTAAIRDGFIANQIQIGAGSIPPFLTGWDRGVNWKILASLNQMSVWLVTRDKSIKTVKDLKPDMKIGMPSLDSLQSLTLRKAAANELGNAHALDTAIVAIDHPSGMQALQVGQLTAHLGAPPFQYQEVQAGGHVVVRSFDVFGPHTFNSVYVGTKFADEHPQFVKALLPRSARRDAVPQIAPARGVRDPVEGLGRQSVRARLRRLAAAQGRDLQHDAARFSRDGQVHAVDRLALESSVVDARHRLRGHAGRRRRLSDSLAVRILEIVERPARIDSDISNAWIDFSQMTASTVAVVTDVVRDGRRVIGYGFNSNGRYAAGGLMRERFILRILGAPPQALLNDEGTNFDPHRIWAVMMTGEKPGGHGERCVAVGTIDMALWDAVAKIEGKPLYRPASAWAGTNRTPAFFSRSAASRTRYRSSTRTCDCPTRRVSASKRRRR